MRRSATGGEAVAGCERLNPKLPSTRASRGVPRLDPESGPLAGRLDASAFFMLRIFDVWGEYPSKACSNWSMLIGSFFCRELGDTDAGTGEKKQGVRSIGES